MERSPTAKPILPCGIPLRPRIDAHVCMWEKLFPKMGQLEWPCSLVGREVYDFLAIVDHPVVLEILLYLYVGMDCRACANIHFTKDEPPDDRDNIMFIFLLN